MQRDQRIDRDTAAALVGGCKLAEPVTLGDMSELLGLIRERVPERTHIAVYRHTAASPVVVEIDVHRFSLWPTT